jgi:inhibitor of KinA sporulation pathway (predicted exonuclease)
MTEPLLLVVDLECTCSDESTPASERVSPEQMEIIEIGAVVATLQGTVVDQFTHFVQASERPALTAFCSSLTGIQQADVNAAEFLDDVLGALDHWLEPNRSRLVGWGSWGAFDQRQLDRECVRKGLRNPLTSLPHTNLKAHFAKRRRIRQVGMAKALEIVGLPLLGQHHRGLDDARNIAQLLHYTVDA